MRHAFQYPWVLAVLLVAACGEDTRPAVVCGNGSGGQTDHCAGASTALVSVSGDVIPFHLAPSGRLAGAAISILEYPDRRVITGADGSFRFDGLAEGSEVTLVMLGPHGAERVPFQAVVPLIYESFAQSAQVVPDPAMCQMVTTVAAKGKSVYEPGVEGESGATVTLTPPLSPEHGPIYTNTRAAPHRALTETTADGGVLFVQVPPGEYVLTATKPGVTFAAAKVKCRAGWFINAAPPWGVQAQ
jgi:hypothetical protein